MQWAEVVDNPYFENLPFKTVKVLIIWSTNLGLYSITQPKINNLKIRKRF